MPEITSEKAVSLIWDLREIKGAYLAEHARPYLDLTARKRALFRGTMGQVMFVKAISDLAKKGILETQINKESAPTLQASRAFSLIGPEPAITLSEAQDDLLRGAYAYVAAMSDGKYITVEFPYPIRQDEMFSLENVLYAIDYRATCTSRPVNLSGYRLMRDTRPVPGKLVEREYEPMPKEVETKESIQNNLNTT